MELESREGFRLDAFNHLDFHQDKLVPYWKRALEVSQEGIVAHVSENHWMSEYMDLGGTGGNVYAVDFDDFSDVQILQSGDFDPFTAFPSGALVFVPNDLEHVLLAPPLGSVCLCTDFIEKNLCDHIFRVLVFTKLVPPPPHCVKVGAALRSHGITRPKNPLFGKRNCLKRLGGKRKAEEIAKESVAEIDIHSPRMASIDSSLCDPTDSQSSHHPYAQNDEAPLMNEPRALVKGDLFLAVYDGFLDLFSFEERKKSRVIGTRFWFDGSVWDKWEGETLTIPVTGIRCTHFKLCGGKIPEYIQEKLCFPSQDPQ